VKPVSVLGKLIPVVLVFIAVIGIFFLPVSSILLYEQPMKNAVQDATRTATEKSENYDLSTTDIDTFTNTEYVFYVPPAYTVEMENQYYLNKAYYWCGDDDYGTSISDGCRGNSMYSPIANCSSIFVSSYERSAHVTIEWLNATALKCHYDMYNGWTPEQGAKIAWASDISRLSGGNITLDTSYNYTVGEFGYIEVPIITLEIAPGWHILSGTVRVKSDVPVTVMHHKLQPGAATDTPEDHYANAWWNGVFSAYGKKLLVRVGGDLWISALEAPTDVRIWDMSDRDDSASFHLDTFESWDYTRNPILQQIGFDDDLVLISASNPISVVGGLEDKFAFTQVYGKDGKDFMFPCFSKVLIYAPDGGKITLDDHTGNQGSFEGDFAPGEMKVFDFRVVYKSRTYPSFEWAQLRASKPVYVYTIGDDQWTLDPKYVGSIAGEDYLCKYKQTSIYFNQGYKPYPAAKEFTVPIRSRAYVTIVNMGEANKVNVAFSELKLPLDVALPAYGSMTVELSENSYEYMDLQGQYARPTDAFWSNRNHPWVYRIVVDTKMKNQVYLTRDNLTKGTTLKVTGSKDLLVFADYERDFQTYATGIDVIPGLRSPTPRGLPEAQSVLVTAGGIVVAMDIVIVAGGGKSLLDKLWKWRA
jgi:hypothetical protein